MNKNYSNKNESYDYIFNLLVNKTQLNKELIFDIKKLNKGMTNDYYVVNYNDNNLYLRIPGKNTNEIINRNNEEHTYKLLQSRNISEDILFFDAVTGIKLSKEIRDTHNCDPNNIDDVKKSINKLKEFHNLKIQTNYDFNLSDKIKYYESKLTKDELISYYPQYNKVKSNIFKLLDYTRSFNIDKSLCHIDSVCDNFLIDKNNNVYLIDWEYSGMQDPHLDIAMFCIYSNYSKAQIDKVIDIYFDNNCDNNIRNKIYAYIAISGFLWSVWCVFKRKNNSNYDEYAKKQYQYAIDYYKIVEDYLK